MNNTCRKGHIFTSRTASGHCPQCQRDAAARYRHRLQANDRLVRSIRGELSVSNAPKVMA